MSGHLLVESGTLESSDTSSDKGPVNEALTESDALGQLPQGWTDRKLLDHEPFLTQFLIREYSELAGLPVKTRNRAETVLPSLDCPGAIREGSNPAFLQAYGRWVRQALGKSRDDDPGLVPESIEIRKSPKLWRLFVEYYWKLYKKKREEAEKLVWAERKARGFVYESRHINQSNETTNTLEAAATNDTDESCDDWTLQEDWPGKQGQDASASPKNGLISDSRPLQRTGVQAPKALRRPSKKVSKPNRRKRSVSAAKEGGLPAAPILNANSSVVSLKTAMKKCLTTIPVPSDIGINPADNSLLSTKETAVAGSSKTSIANTHTLLATNKPNEGAERVDANLKRKLKTKKRTPKSVGNSRQNKASKGNMGTRPHEVKDTTHIARDPKKGKGREASSLWDARIESTATEKHPNKRKYRDPPGEETPEVTQGTKDELHSFIDANPKSQTVTKRQKWKTAGRVDRSSQSLNIDEGALSSGSRIIGRRIGKPVWVLPKEVTDNAAANGTTYQFGCNVTVEESDQQPPPPTVLRQPALPLVPETGTYPLSSLESDKTLVERPRISDGKIDPQNPQEVLKQISDVAGISQGPGKLLDIDRLLLNVTDVPQQTTPKAPLPDGKRPRIWAASRQALCETTTWFRAYHGGVYHNDGKAHGYLLGGYSSQRDVFCHDGRLIISHGGGKSLDGSSGQSEQDHSVRALLNGFENHYPIVLVADDKYALFPYDLGKYMYAVLGLYWIVDAWAEMEVSGANQTPSVRVKYKFAFQYCEGQGEPWWQKDEVSPSSRPGGTSVDPGHPETNGTAIQSNGLWWDRCTESPNRNDCELFERTKCVVCGEASPLVYEKGWLCLHPSCSEFFRMGSEEYQALKYDSRFLKLRPHPNFGSIDLTPKSPIEDLEAPAETVYSARGWWCHNCGQLCPREKWECWDCPDCEATFLGTPPLPIRVHSEFWDQEAKLMGSKNFKHHKIYKGSGISFSTSMWKKPDSSEGGQLFTYELPEQRGRIHLISGNPRVNQRANNLFKLFQEEARAGSFLRRYPLRATQVRGRMLANYFSHNSGVPYKYVVGTNTTVPFEQAPKSVNGALQLIKDRASLVVNESANFNEILTAAYMVEQRMAYHTDDEKGLGPIVSSLSLGSLALMHFRLHEAPTTGQREKELTLVLRHGDVLVMTGAKIQKAYDHTVVPMDFRIAATARYIDPYSLQ